MLHFWKDYPHIQRDLIRVQEIMRASLQGRDPLLTHTIQTLLNRNGKMLRPGFVVLGARLKLIRNHPYPVQKPLPEKIYQIAAAVEILHLATLIHDDVIDRAQTRRGAPTMNAEIGDRNAVLTGDFLFSRCFSIVADYATMENARVLARGVSHICESEIAQSKRFDLSTLSVRNYLHRIIGKTAFLFSLSLFVGAEELKAPQSLTTSLRRIGYSVGISFQIIDDILDIIGTPDTTGKSTGGDLREGIYTLPVILAAFENRNTALALYSPENLSTPSGYEKARTFILSQGGVEKAREYAKRYTERALREASRIPPSENRTVLIEVIEKLLHRSY
ncbi:MAG: polyprenyl synthetase family protein [Spirochaetes bacterium]|nr:polyprenyl synthetase family protein [Spirochaetota bacterium]